MACSSSGGIAQPPLLASSNFFVSPSTLIKTGQRIPKASKIFEGITVSKSGVLRKCTKERSLAARNIGIPFFGLLPSKMMASRPSCLAWLSNSSRITPSPTASSRIRSSLRSFRIRAALREILSPLDIPIVPIYLHTNFSLRSHVSRWATRSGFIDNPAPDASMISPAFSQPLSRCKLL